MSKNFTKLALLPFALFICTICNAQYTTEQLEQNNHIKIGVYAIDTKTGKIFSHHQNDRFPLQSTAKIIISAAALKNTNIKEKIKISSNDIIFWSPVTKINLDNYMTIEKLAKAAISYSDNTANNILIKKLGGVKKINEFAKSIGNLSFDLKNIEPNLNSNPNNTSDTSTPKDMAQSIQMLLLEKNILSPANQLKLRTWMTNNTTGYNKIRSKLPPGWHAAEKTGSSSVISNDIGIVWSLECKPIIICIFTISNHKNNNKRNESIQLTTKIILEEFSKNNTCFTSTKFK